jgi:hypothetical protein
MSRKVVCIAGNRADSPSPDRTIDVEDTMIRTTLTASRARRCSGLVVAATAAAVLMAPGTAFAAGQPSGPVPQGPVSHSGHSAGHTGQGHGHGHPGSHAGRNSAGRAGGHTAGHTTSHTTGHAGHPGRGHSAGHSGTGRTTGHPTNHPASHSTGAGKTGAASGTSRSSGPGDSSDSASGGSASSSTSTSTSSAGLADTVTKVSVSNADDGTMTMSARVSTAHRTTGAAPATGTVEFFLDGASSGPIPLSGGRASVQIELAPGEHTGSAHYSGDAEHAPSDSGPVSLSAT